MEASKRRSLHEIVADFRELIWLSSDESIERDLWLEQEIDSCRAEMKEKIDACLGLADAFAAQAGTCTARAKKLAEQGRVLDHRRARLVEYVKRTLEEAELTRLQTASFPTIAIRRNPPKLEIADDATIPPQYTEEVVTVKILKAEIKKALKNKAEIPGCRLVQGTRLEY